MSPHVHVTYCDDIRNELGNKVSLMGVYGADMYVQEFPTVLAKLCASVSVVVPVDLEPKEVTVKLSLGEKVIFETGNMVSMLPRPPIPKFDADDQEAKNVLMYGVHVVMSPFAAEGPSRLRCRAYLDGVELRGNGLIITQAQKAETVVQARVI